MKSGDFVSIDYVGKVKDTGEVFDATVEEAARKNNVHNPNVSYRPVNIVVGGEFTIKGLDEALLEMKVGEKRTIVIEPDKAFGARNPEFLRSVPMSNFKNQDIDPTPGSYITINGMRGRIVSADGGRIRVDFNHPLAGKKLEYEVEVKGEITDTVQKVKAIVSYITGEDPSKLQAKVDGKSAEIDVPREQHEGHEHDWPVSAKRQMAGLITKWVSGIERVRFVDEFGK